MSDSDIEDYTMDLLQRCEARSKVIKGTLSKPGSEHLLQKEQENEPTENIPVLKESNEDVVPANKEMKSIPLVEQQESVSPPQLVGNALPLADHNFQISASPQRRTRLKELAQTINGWEDDCTHHNALNSRFNLTKPNSPQRKPFILSSPQAKADTNNGVRHVVKPISYAGFHNNSKTSFISASKEFSSDKKKGFETINVENVSKDVNFSCDSSLELEDGEDAYCSDDGETLKNSDLSDSFTFFTSTPDNNTKSEENERVDSKAEKIVTQKCILDDSVVHALEAQGFVYSPSTAKLSYQYKNCELKENPSQKYQLPGPKKSEPPVKRAGSPVRQPPICSKTPSPVKNSPAVVDSGPRVVDLFRKFENVSKELGKDKPVSTASRLDSATTRISVAQKAAMYETMNSNSHVREIDPIELSVAERMKLFERAKNGLPAAAASRARQRSTSPTRSFENTDAVSRRAPRPSMIPAQPLKAKLKLFERGVKEDGSKLQESDEEVNVGKGHSKTTGKTAFSLKPDVVPYATSTAPLPPPMPGFVRSRSVSPQRVAPFNQSNQNQLLDDGFESSEEDNTVPNSPISRKSPSPKKEVSFAILSKSPKSPVTPKSPVHFKSPASLKSPVHFKSPVTPKSPLQFKRPSTSPSSGKRSMSPKANYPGTRDLKRIRVNDPKPGRMYPSLTDIDTTEAETDTDADNNIEMRHHPDTLSEHFEDDDMDSETSIVSGSSLGTYIERQAIQNSPLRAEEQRRKFRPSEEFNTSLACRKVDEFIDEALEGQDCSMETNIYESSPVATSSPVKNVIPSPGTVHNLTNQNLVHTVSFYRRQQTIKSVASNSINLTPKRVIIPVEEETSPEERTFSYEDQINERIAKLEHESQTQQRSMAQASKALSLCKSMMEFSDSTEYVEFERVLLISTQKNSAIINEIHRLKTEGILGRKAIHSPSKGDFAPSCKGNMTLHDFKIHLKRDFMNQARLGETIYHFIALVKYRNQLQASGLVCFGNKGPSSNFTSSTVDFPNSFTIENLDPDFSVTVEVYVLEARKEFIPHEAKYHIKTEKGKVTPKKHKGDTYSRFTHFQHSPAGPNAILASKFQQVGCFTIDICTLQRNHWEFDKMLNTTHLEKMVSINIQCSAEGGVGERGFLTMFQDVSGYGNWHRRWCKLTPSELCFWMYPEDEPNEPMGKIPLRACVTSRVGPVARDVCARANTFLLVTTRAPQHGDKDSLVKSCRDNYTAVRHLISADTKEERDLWCKQFNRALANLRAWDPHAYAPDDTLF